MREIRTSGSTKGEWAALYVSPSLLLYREFSTERQEWLAKPPSSQRKSEHKQGGRYLISGLLSRSSANHFRYSAASGRARR